jgi:small redox-active disulfide protein 2
MKIEVLGTGCPSCRRLEENVRKAVAELKLKAEVEKIEDIEKIMAYGVVSVPALVVDGEVLFSGRSPSPHELKGILEDCV